MGNLPLGLLLAKGLAESSILDKMRFPTLLFIK